MQKKIRVGALVSGTGTNLQAIIDACENGDINAKMAFVGSDRPEAPGLSRARKHKIPSFSVDYRTIIQDYTRQPDAENIPKDFSYEEMISRQNLWPRGSSEAEMRTFFITRAIAEAQLLKAMTPYPFDLIVLAGYMRTLTPYFIDRINIDPDQPRIMNIHPALLPMFPGTDGYGDTFRYGCKVGGCTVHFVDYGEDTGPIIGQKSFDIDSEDTLDSVREKGLEKEWELYPHCIQLFSEKRLNVEDHAYPLPDGSEVTRRIVRISSEQDQ